MIVCQDKKYLFYHTVLIACLFVIIGSGWYVQENFLLMFSSDSQMAGIVEAKEEKELRQKRNQGIIKGLYLTAASANNPQKVDDIIALINTTELNAVVIDIKDYTGYVLYDSQVPLVNELKTERHIMKDVPAVLQKFHDNGIYVIARQTVFQDPVLAQQKKEWAIKSKQGDIWKDHKGLPWVDPTKKEVWDYNVVIAKEAIALGFDEMNFDYVRFPSDGDMSQVVYTNKGQSRAEVMRDFFAFLSGELINEPAWLSLDMFGFVMERHDGMSIGQRLSDAVDFADFISPMMYPSHYPAGHLGLKNPAASPGIVIDNGMKKGLLYFEGKRAMVRPWLQAFHIGAKYGAKNIRAQIDAVEKYPNAGWLLWNAANRYSGEGLKGE